MKLVVDTNILLRALIRNSATRSLLLNPNHEFCVPKYAIEEVEKYFGVIRSKSGLSRKEIRLLFELLLSRVRIVPFRPFYFEEAEKVMEKIDETDAPFSRTSFKH